MIINKTNRFAFIHIPKCGGTSVRTILDEVNEWSYFGNPWIAETKKLGTIDFGHLTLSALKILFPEDFDLVLDYESYAIVRDPYERFFSSIHEKLKQDNRRKNVVKKFFTPEEIQRETKEVIEYLMKIPNSASGNLLPYTHIHFQRQIDYLFLDGVKVINHVFCLKNIDTLFDSIQNQTGLQFSDGATKNSIQKANVTERYRYNWTKKISDTNHPIVNSLKKLSPFILKRLQRKLFFTKSAVIKSEARNPVVKNFIASYYNEDIELYKRVCRENSFNSTL
jgi:hypothetical protein